MSGNVSPAGPGVAPVRPRFAPSVRLVVAAAVVLVPAALADVALRAGSALVLVTAVVLTLLALADAVAGLRRAGGVRVTIPPLTRLALGRPAPCELELTPDDATGWRTPRLRLGLVTPPGLGIDEPETDVVPIPAARVLRVAWRAQPRRRGCYVLTRLHVEVPSRLGWWTLRWAVDFRAEVRVYPNLREEGRRVAALFLRRSSAAGWRRQRLVGRGRDFEKLREYLPGDGFDEIHWKATAKRGHPVTKVFQVERTQEVYAVIDASRLSGRRAAETREDDGDVDDTLLERQVNAALALARAAERQGDRFGLATYADRPRQLLRAKNGGAHFQACREVLVGLQATPVSPDFREVCTFLRARLTKRALLVFLTSLDDPAIAEAFVEAVALVARRHRVLVAAPLPAEARALFTGEPPASLDAAYGRLGGHLRWQSLQDLGAMLQRHGVQLALLRRDELAAGAVSQYLSLKQRQAI